MPKTQKAKLSKLKKSRRGFTLIITITLMVLLTLIGIGLLSLSSVSMRASSQAYSMSVARSNARMALILAINELQKSAGPDQRITARSDILGEDLVRPRLTGVWKSRNPIAAPPQTAKNDWTIRRRVGPHVSLAGFWAPKSTTLKSAHPLDS